MIKFSLLRIARLSPRWPLFLVAGIFLLAGCGKKPTATAASNAVAEAAVSQSAPLAGNAPRVVPITVAASVDASAQLAQLTQVLRRYAVEHRRVPQSLAEVVAAGYLTALPAAPAGKQFVVDAKRMQVLLE
jgi:hypothetical protein